MICVYSAVLQTPFGPVAKDSAEDVTWPIAVTAAKEAIKCSGQLVSPVDRRIPPTK